MCWKYKNNHGTVYIYCDILNGKRHSSSYLTVFNDLIDGYEVIIITALIVERNLKTRREYKWKN